MGFTESGLSMLEVGMNGAYDFSEISVEGLCVSSFFWNSGRIDISLYDPTTCRAFVHFIEGLIIPFSGGF